MPEQVFTRRMEWWESLGFPRATLGIHGGHSRDAVHPVSTGWGLRVVHVGDKSADVYGVSLAPEASG